MDQNTQNNQFYLTNLAQARRAEPNAQRPKPGPGRHRSETQALDPWERALTGPPISAFEQASSTADYSIVH